MLESHTKPGKISALTTGVLLVALGYILRIVGLQAQGLWRDEVDALLFATAPWAELLGNFTRPGWNGPFYFVLLRGWVALAGQSAFALRYFSLLGGVFSVSLTYVLARRLLGSRSADCAALLMACAPYQVWYAQEVKMYTWITALALLALYALERAVVIANRKSQIADSEFQIQNPKSKIQNSALWWLVVLIAISLAVYSHILAALLIPVACVWFVLHPRRAPRAWIGGLVTLALLTLPYLPLLLWQAPLLLQPVQDTGYPIYTLGQMTQVLLSGWSAGIVTWGGSWAITLGGVLLCGGVMALGWRKQARVAGQLLGWLLLPLLAIWAISLRRPLFTDRYLIWAAPAFYLLLAAGWGALRGRWRGIEFALLALSLFFAGGNLYRQAVQPIKPQFREAAAYLQVHHAAEDVFLFQIPYNARVVSYYAPELGPILEAPFTNWRTVEGNYQMGVGYVDEQLRALLPGEQSVWLIYSEAAMWDERDMVKAWFDLHGRLTTEAHFLMVSLYRYRLSSPP